MGTCRKHRLLYNSLRQHTRAELRTGHVQLSVSQVLRGTETWTHVSEARQRGKCSAGRQGVPGQSHAALRPDTRWVKQGSTRKTMMGQTMRYLGDGLGRVNLVHSGTCRGRPAWEEMRKGRASAS
jgi:hypothetical protein